MENWRIKEKQNRQEFEHNLPGPTNKSFSNAFMYIYCLFSLKLSVPIILVLQKSKDPIGADIIFENSRELESNARFWAPNNGTKV